MRTCQDPLFEKRVPEAAAVQLAIVLASATEWNLATLERLESRKSSTAYDRHRQKEICDKLVEHCKDLNVQPVGLRGEMCQRLKERLEKSA